MNLAEELELGPDELVAFVGAGGKTTLMLRLGRELAGGGSAVIVTTTTRLGAEQVGESVCRVSEPSAVERALALPEPLFVVGEETEGKADGLTGEAVDALFRETTARQVLVESDGARRLSIKAPADHEPAIPSAATLVVVVAGIDAVGRPLGEVAHRPDRVAALTGLAVSDPVEPEHVAGLIAHPRGGLKSIPAQARVVVALTKVTAGPRHTAATQVRSLLAATDRIERVVIVPELTTGAT